MKVTMTETVKNASTGLTFFKNKTYRAETALNQPGAVRLGKGGEKILVQKVFVGKGKMRADIDTMLINKNDFKIVDFPEMLDLLKNYKNSKIKVAREKKICPDGFKLRENFRPFNENEQTDNLARCEMGTNDGQCNRPAKYVKEIGARIKVARCLRHASFKV